MMEKRTVRNLFIAAISIGLALMISGNWFRLMLIQGESMSPTLNNMQLVLIDQRESDFQKGDIVAFHCRQLKSVLVKRIAGSGGDQIAIKSGKLYVNGRVSEVFPEEYFSFAGTLEQGITLGEGEYIVIGDNTEKSIDSRYPEVYIVSEKDMIGRVIPFCHVLS